MTRTGGMTRATSRPRSGDSRRARPGRPGRDARRSNAAPTPTWPSCDALDAGIAACIARSPPPAQARHRPRRVRLLRQALRDRSRRRRHPLADHPGPALGEGPQRARRANRRERVKAVFPESSLNPKLAEAIARETGASADHTLYGDTLGPEGSTARPTSAWRRPTPTRWSAASPAVAPRAACASR